MKEIYLKGFLDIGDGIELSSYSDSLAETIENKIRHLCEENNVPIMNSESEEDDYCTEASILVPKVSLRMFFSDKECTLEEAEENQILKAIGALDIYQEWTGYSEWTILGYDVVNFKLVGNDGEHDLEQILRSYVGKYVHIIFEILE